MNTQNETVQNFKSRIEILLKDLGFDIDGEKGKKRIEYLLDLSSEKIGKMTNLELRSLIKNHFNYVSRSSSPGIAYYFYVKALEEGNEEDILLKKETFIKALSKT